MSGTRKKTASVKRWGSGLFKRGDSPYWWASYTDIKGKRVRRSTETENRKEAEAIRAQWKLEVYNQKQWGIVPHPLFDDVLSRYVENREVFSSSQAAAAQHLYDDLAGTNSATTVATVRAVIKRHQREGRAPATINKIMVMWSAAINEYNRDIGVDIPNPVSGQKLPEPEGVVRWITHEEAALLIEATRVVPNSPILEDAVQIALNTGMRRTEVLGLLVSEIDIVNRTFNPGRLNRSRKGERRRTKSGKGRTIPMTDVTLAIVEKRLQFRAKYCPESRFLLTRKDGTRYLDLKRGFNRALKAAGVTDFRWHDLRHTFASWLVQEGVSLQEVKELLGHSSIKQTEIYAHLAPEQLRRAISKLPAICHDLVTLQQTPANPETIEGV